MTTKSEETAAAASEACEKLTELLRTVDLSAPSITKFEDVRAWVASRVGLDLPRVAVYWVSKPGNFDVRFRQPGVLRNRPYLGIALVPGEESLGGYLKPARRLVEHGDFQAIAVCARQSDGWRGEAAFLRTGSQVDATGGGLIDAGAVLEVGSRLDDPRKDPDSGDVSDRLRLRPGVDWGERDIESPPEGLDRRDLTGWGEYPLDSVFVRTETRTVGEVVKRINAGRYQLDPDFQRDFVWAPAKQSRLIESCTMRIPLPVFYVAEMKDGRIAVVDGLQRLTTFTRYLNGEFALTGLDNPESDATHPLSGKKFEELPIALAERIEDTQLTLYILDAKAPERAKLDIFERVNSGVPLSRQQMRNSLYNGPATVWLKKAAADTAFLEATGKSLDQKSMRDREAINRFCAFYRGGWMDYQAGDMDTFLGQTLEHLNGTTPEQLDALMSAFSKSMQLNGAIFGRHAFRKSLADTSPDADRTVINISLFDVCSVLLAAADEAIVRARIAGVKDAFRSLIGDEEFNHAITYSTNSTRQVKARFELASAATKDVLGC